MTVMTEPEKRYTFDELVAFDKTPEEEIWEAYEIYKILYDENDGELYAINLLMRELNIVDYIGSVENVGNFSYKGCFKTQQEYVEETIMDRYGDHGLEVMRLVITDYEATFEMLTEGGEVIIDDKDGYFYIYSFN